MAIQVRRGLEKDFDPEKALPGEWLLSTDTRYIRMCITPGVVLRMATYEAFEADMAKIHAVLTECKDIQSAITGIQAIVASKAALTVEYANSAAGYAKAAAASEAKAKTYAENASAVAGVGIAKQDTAGLMKGGENYVDESGALVLTKTTTDNTLPHSKAGGIKLLGLYGVSVQDSTTGAQLFDVNDKYDTFSNDNDGWISVSANNTGGTGTLYVGYDVNPSQLLETNTEYAIVIEIKEWSGTGRVLTVTGTSDSTKGQFGTGDSSTVTANGTYVIKRTTRESFADCITMLRTVLEVGAGNTLSLKMRLSVLADTSVTADTFVYEKFTGGAPSPSVDYPQEIKKSVVSEILSHGKNLLKNKASTITSKGVTFTVNDDKSITISGELTDSNVRIKLGTIKTVVGKTYTVNGAFSSATSAMIALTKSGESSYVVQCITSRNFVANVDSYDVFIRISDMTSITDKTWYPMIREADITDDTYEPYTETVATLSEPIELNGLNGVTDDLVSGTKRFAELVLDGTNTQLLYCGLGTSGTETTLNLFYIDLPTVGIHSYNDLLLSTHYRPKNGLLSEDFTVRYKGGGNRLYFSDSRFTSAEEMNAWLQENNVKVVYELANPVTESLPTADQIALNSLKSFDGTTYVYCDSEVQPTWELEYGTSRVGALALENHCRENVNEIRLNELTTAMLVINQE